MDNNRGRNKRRGRGNRGANGQQGSPSQSPAAAAGGQQQVVGQREPTRPTNLTMENPEYKAPNSPLSPSSNTGGSDSEFLTPISSPTELLTPDPSPEPPLQKSKPAQQAEAKETQSFRSESPKPALSKIADIKKAVESSPEVKRSDVKAPASTDKPGGESTKVSDAAGSPAGSNRATKSPERPVLHKIAEIKKSVELPDKKVEPGAKASSQAAEKKPEENKVDSPSKPGAQPSPSKPVESPVAGAKTAEAKPTQASPEVKRSEPTVVKAEANKSESSPAKAGSQNNEPATVSEPKKNVEPAAAEPKPKESPASPASKKADPVAASPAATKVDPAPASPAVKKTDPATTSPASTTKVDPTPATVDPKKTEPAQPPSQPEGKKADASPKPSSSAQKNTPPPTPPEVKQPVSQAKAEAKKIDSPASQPDAKKPVDNPSKPEPTTAAAKGVKPDSTTQADKVSSPAKPEIQKVEPKPAEVPIKPTEAIKKTEVPNTQSSPVNKEDKKEPPKKVDTAPKQPEVVLQKVNTPLQVPKVQAIPVQGSGGDQDGKNSDKPPESVAKDTTAGAKEQSGEKSSKSEKPEEGAGGSAGKPAKEARKKSAGNPEQGGKSDSQKSGGNEGSGGGGGGGGAGDSRSTSVEIEKSQGSKHELQSSLITGKPGYLGGRAGLGEHTTSYDTDDSLMTAERRPNASGGSGWMGFTRRQVLTLLVFSVADFFSAIIISLQGPFYPQEAESKGASGTEFGLVFGVFELVVFITSPIYGKYLHRIGPKYVFNTGIVVTATATILFGFLDRIEDRTTFVALSFVVRIVEALGDAAFVTASFAIIAAEFPDSVATTFASLETFFGLGLIVGPTLGGALFEKGGFTLPFVVMGGLLFAVGILTFLLMPNISSSNGSEKEAPKGMLDILKVPGVLIAALAIVNGSITIGFLNSTLEPHIRQFGLNGVLTGLVFIINGGLYAVSAPAWGWLCDRALQPKYTGLIGVVAIFIGFLFIGPVPFIPIETTLWLVAVGLVIHGIGLGAALVSAFVMALKESIDHGFADNIQTYGLTSALWTSSFALGAFIGPSVGGVLLDYAGFNWATVFVLAVQLVMAILLSAYLIKSRRYGGFSQRNLSESAPLLTSGSEDPCTSKSALQRQDEGRRKEGTGYGSLGDTAA